LILQGLEGKVPPVLSGMLANELYLVSFVMQMMGLRWFVHHEPLRHKWPFVTLGLALATYTAMFLLRIPYGGNVINVPNIAVCCRSIRHGHPLCMIVADVDHFKNLNDARGHAAGDCALQALVRQAKAMMRGNDLLARTGGEEFTILLPDTAAFSGAVTAERLRQAIEALEVPFENRPIRFTISTGVAQFDPSQGDWENMMRRADSAMYDAKEHGRNVVSPRAARPQPAQTDQTYII
jgi:diguanylate cyclase (GGDEF)-like protein